MLNSERLCLGCMTDNGGEKICPICGYDTAAKNPDDCLPTKFIIGDRYLVGKFLKKDGESVTYIGWDNSSDTVINIKEYFPQGFAHRNPDKTVSIIKGGEYTFNECLLEFMEINRNIMKSELPSLIPVTDVFEENGTVYAISKNISGITLEQFLEKNGGILKWEQARALFLPLIDTIKGMNELGIIHRGISAETIIVGRDGKLRISDYCVKKVRMSDTQLNSKIYSGYAAAEQYGIENLNDGAHTDVYGLSSTLFRVLIGVVPPSAEFRLSDDSMTIPAKFAGELPRHVLSALANGLQVLPKDRTENIEDFKNELVYGESPEYKVPVVKKSSNKNNVADKKEKKSGSAKYLIISAVCTVVVLLGLGAVLMFTVFKDNIFPPDIPDVSSDQNSIDAPVVDELGSIDSNAAVSAKLYDVPDFKGKYYSQIFNAEEYEMFKITIKDKEFSAEIPKGAICSQSVAAGTGVAKDTEIQIVVSLGPQEVKIANLKGLDELNAKLELLKQGFLYNNIEVLEKYDEEYASGVVIEQEPKYGESVNTDIGVKIYINSYKEDFEASEQP